MCIAKEASAQSPSPQAFTAAAGPMGVRARAAAITAKLSHTAMTNALGTQRSERRVSERAARPNAAVT